MGRPVVTNIVAMHNDWGAECWPMPQLEVHLTIHGRAIRSTEERRIIPPYERCEVWSAWRRGWADGRTLLLGVRRCCAPKSSGVKKASRWVDKLRDPAAARGGRGRPECVRAAQVLTAGQWSPDRHAGDHRRSPRLSLKRAQVDEWRAEVMPEDKLAAVRELQDDLRLVGMVGDGIENIGAGRRRYRDRHGLAGTDVAVGPPMVSRWPTTTCSTLGLGERAVDVSATACPSPSTRLAADRLSPVAAICL